MDCSVSRFLLQISINKDKGVEDPPKHHLPKHSFSARCKAKVWHQQFCPVKNRVL